MDAIARIHSAYPTKFGVPRQPGLVDALEATVEFEEPYRNPDAIRGLEDFDYVWLIWAFSHNERTARGGRAAVGLPDASDVACGQPAWSPTVRPPILGGTTRQGVFATRSSFRPNGLALSCVRLTGVEPRGRYRDGSQGPLLRVTGADMVDGTPIYDIKPYLPYVDAHPDARAGWTQNVSWPEISQVDVPAEQMAKVPPELREGLVQLLRQDPRPAYTRRGQEAREFWVPLGTEPGRAVAVYFTVERVAGEGERADGRGDECPSGGLRRVCQRLRVTRVERLSDDELERVRRTGSL